MFKDRPYMENLEYASLVDVELLAGDPAWLWDVAFQRVRDRHALYMQVVKADWRGKMHGNIWSDYTGYRWSVFTSENHLFSGMVLPMKGPAVRGRRAGWLAMGGGGVA